MAYFETENKSIYYETYGEGKPLVLLNGIMMSTASWKEFVEPLSKNNKLILIDFLDQGKSSKMTGEKYDHKIQIEILKRTLDYLGIEKAVLAGISYGSEVALEFAIIYPEMVEKLILFNATAATGYWLSDIGRAWNLAAGNGEAYYHTSIPVIYSPDFYKDRHDWMERRKEILVPLFSNTDFIEAMIRLTESSDNYDVKERLGELECPTLIVSCEDDYLTPLKEQEYIAENTKNSHHVILPNSGHATMYEQPLLFASLILGFANVSKVSFNI